MNGTLCFSQWLHFDSVMVSNLHLCPLCAHYVPLCPIKKEYEDLQVRATVTLMFFWAVAFSQWLGSDKKSWLTFCLESDIDGLKKAATSYRSFHKASSAPEQVHSVYQECFQEPVKLLANIALSEHTNTHIYMYLDV